MAVLGGWAVSYERGTPAGMGWGFRPHDFRGGQQEWLHARVMQHLIRVWGLGFGVWGLGFGVWGLGFGVWGLGIMV